MRRFISERLNSWWKISSTYFHTFTSGLQWAWLNPQTSRTPPGVRRLVSELRGHQGKVLPHPEPQVGFGDAAVVRVDGVNPGHLPGDQSERKHEKKTTLMHETEWRPSAGEERLSFYTQHEKSTMLELVSTQPEYRRVPDILRAQSFPVNKLIADAVLKGAVETRSTAVSVENLHKTKREEHKTLLISQGKRSGIRFTAFTSCLILVFVLPGNF